MKPDPSAPAQSSASATLPFNRCSRLSREVTSTTAAVIALVAAIGLRLAILFRYRIDSDETQHLHVVWGWSRGLLPYRDMFDNHMPLFHLLAVPLLRLAGERPEALILGRLAMLPLFALITLLTYRIGVSCNSHRAALIGTLIGISAPPFFLCSVEFRPDVLWTTFWLTTIAFLVDVPLTTGRAAAAGLALGIAASVSAKTVLFGASIGIAAIATLVITRDGSVAPRGLWKRATTFAGMTLLPPSLIAAYFAAQGAWKPFVYCTITHNLVSSEHPQRILLLAPLLVLIVLATRRINREDLSAGVRKRRLFLFLAASSYGAVMLSLWPIIEREHWLPFYALAGVAAAPLLWPSGGGWPRSAIAILALEFFWIIGASTPWRDEVIPSTTLIEQAMKLTTPGETILDLKGEIVFRPRAFYYELEKITKKAIAKGRLQDTIAADVIRTRTMVAVEDNRSFPRRSRSFLLRNFVSVGCLRVAGMIVPPSHTFRIELPGDYSVVSASGGFQGTLDGMPYQGPRRLTNGTHILGPASASDQTAVLWQRAASLGFSPFTEEHRCREGKDLTGRRPARSVGPRAGAEEPHAVPPRMVDRFFPGVAALDTE
ncbi:MAG TPA: hypothetical protein VHL58_10875 [Thermoanaerobaculia bacterium]|nr:hypothetical protein [Thermoanaerobaculia bacterium]